MSEEQEIAAKIGELGEKIKAAKTEKKPKEEWEPILNEMLALKVSLLRNFYFSFSVAPSVICPFGTEDACVDRCSDWDYTANRHPSTYDIL